MTKSYSDLLREARARVREVSTARSRPPARVEGAARSSSTCASTLEWDAGHIPGAVHVPRGHLESRSRPPSRTATRRSSSTAPAASAPSSPRRRWPSWATPTSSSMPAASRAGRRRACRGPRRTVLTPEQKVRYSRHLLIPEVGAERPGEAARLEGADHRRRRPRLARRRCTSPRPASARSGSSTSTSSSSRTSSARSSTRPSGSARRRSSRRARRSQALNPGRERRHPRRDARRRQRRAAHRRLRRDPRRHRHVRDALPAQRRGGDRRASRWSTPPSSGSRAS